MDFPQTQKFQKKSPLVRWFSAMILILGLLLVNATVRAGATNLIPEGSNFEAGWDGWSVDPLILLPNWKTYVPPSIDCTTAAKGHCSLKLVNGSGDDVFRVSSQGIRIVHTSGSITLSLYAKTDTPGCAISFTLNNGFKAVVYGSATLTRHWKRFHVTVTPKRWYYPNFAGMRNAFYVQIVVPSTRPWKTIWIDAVQLQHGGLTPYVNPARFDLAFTCNRLIKVYTPAEVPQIVLHAAGKNVTAQPVVITEEELFSHREFPALTLHLKPTINANHGSVVIPLKPEPRGLYRLTARMADGQGFQQIAYGVIKPLGRRPHADAAFFGGSIACIMSSTVAPYWGFGPNHSSLMTFDYPPQQVFKFVHQLGWGWWHTYWALAFQTIEPEGTNKFRWRDSDELVALAQKYHLDVYVNLAAHGGPDQQPAWARSDIACVGGSWPVFQNQHIVNAIKFGNFAHAIAEHYKGRIFMWEPYNEPGVKMAAQLYVPLQQQVYRNIKEVDPRNQVYGLCVTSMHWLQHCLQLGLGRYMDGIAIHGGSNKHNWAGQVRRMARQFTGKTYPIINSESSGPNGAIYPNLLPALALGVQNPAPMTPQQLVEYIAQERAAGVARESWFNVTSSQLGIFAHSLDLLEYDGAPSMPLIACNTLIDYIGPSVTHRVVHLGGNLRCYVFGNGGNSVALLWAAGASHTITIPVSADQMVLDNMAGQAIQPQAANGRSVTVRLTGKVVYLRAAHLPVVTLSRILARATIPGLSQVFITRVAIGRAADGHPQLVAMVKGNVAVPQQGTLDLMGSPHGWRFSQASVAFPAVTLDQRVPVTLPIISGLQRGADAPVRLGIRIGSKLVVHSFRLKVWPAGHNTRPPTLGQHASGWKHLVFRRLSKWAQASITWNRRGLYIAAKVHDTTPRGFNPSSGKADWQADGVELYFNPTINNQFTHARYGPADFQVICAVRGGKGTINIAQIAWRGHEPSSSHYHNLFAKPHTVVMQSSRNARGYRVVIYVPWKDFPPTFKPRAGNFLGFGLSVRDMSKTYHQLRRVIWGGNNNDYRYVTGLGVLVLK